MTTAMSTSEAPARVPAWKRLGLKLKYAKDTAQGAENTQSQVDKIPSVTSTDTLNKPQKRPFETTQPPTPLKRSKPVNKGPPIHSNPSGGKRSAFDDYQRSRAQAPQRYTGSLGPSGTLQAAGVAPKKIVFDDDDQ
ncbi:hypothetical protein DOTSEDRAFT_32910 [Dothistroma septosporum NZE10]|uniref:Uncharacterized protein n=1 Tax=Dothistroma septosporum (strain NZE10 / CBS 128990) TaxID=675120 RepID=N1PV79_DOTSN|nr:hypothetical protein DOTSEDRAFT_32910 [Dothistroma septosporum NZE10]